MISDVLLFLILYGFRFLYWGRARTVGDILRSDDSGLELSKLCLCEAVSWVTHDYGWIGID